MPSLIKIQYSLFKVFSYINQEIGNFQILIGPNASGKSSFLDGLSFVKYLTNNTLDSVIDYLVEGDFYSLVHMRNSNGFILAFDFAISPAHQKLLAEATDKSWYKNYKHSPDIVRYEIKIAIDDNGTLHIEHEALLLGFKEKAYDKYIPRQVELFPNPVKPHTETLVAGKRRPGWYIIFSRKGDTVYFRSETTNWNMPYKVGSLKLGLSAIPEDIKRFPVAISIRDFFASSVQHVQLVSDRLRKPSPPGSPTSFKPDGSNLARVISVLKTKHSQQYKWWLRQVKNILADVSDISVFERPEDKHSYLSIQYNNGIEIPSWSLSDGTLRIIALTLIGYLPEKRLYTIEEPENGIHPKALEGVYEVLSNMKNSQVLLATHSPVLLRLAGPNSLLIFAKNSAGVGDVVSGTAHPLIRSIQNELDLDLLFASGVLS